MANFGTKKGHFCHFLTCPAAGFDLNKGLTVWPFACNIIGVNHIEQAVSHLKAAAQDRAEQYARKVVADVQADIAAKGGLSAAAPVPRAWQAPTETTFKYRAAQQKRELYKAIMASADKFVQDARDNAAAQYDAFVAKLNEKIGPVTRASLQGNHVWGYSNLTVVTAAGETQVWRTQQILNVSKLGKVFNQYPTRRVKQ